MGNIALSTTFGSGLKDEEYAEYHILRKKASTMDELQLEKFQSLIRTNFSKYKKFTVLSVGSGEGDFDRDFIKSIASRIDRYVCIEPLKEHLGPLKANLLKVLSEDQIEIHQTTAEDFYTDRKFDIIHNVHVLHWIKNPVGFLKKLESYLSKGGLNITVLQSESGMPRLYSKLKPTSKGSLTAEKLLLGMRKEGITHYRIDYVPSELDVTSIANRQVKGKKILEFVISAKLTNAQFFQAVPLVLELAEIRKNKTVISEPFAFVVNERKPFNWYLYKQSLAEIFGKLVNLPFWIPDRSTF